jgi:hypothetical protein
MPFDSTPRIAATFSTMPLAGTIAPGDAEHADQARARIGRAAHDLQRIAVAGIDRQHLQLVGLRMRRGGQHLRDLETASFSPGFSTPSTSSPIRVSASTISSSDRVGVEMLLEPAQRELHAPTPPLSVGTSSAEKP